MVTDYTGKYRTDIIAACIRAEYSDEYILKMFEELCLADEQYVLETIFRIRPLLEKSDKI